MKKTPAFTLIAAYLLVANPLAAQLDANYWTNDYGTKGQLLSGSFIANTTENSAVFYNPGAIKKDTSDTESVSFSLISPIYSVIRTNSVQTGEAKIKDLDLQPDMVTLAFRRRKWRDLNLALTIFGRNEINTEFQSSISNRSPAGESFVGSYNYRNKREELWIGAGLSYRISRNLSVGLSQFWVSTDHSQSVITESKILSDPTDSMPLRYSQSFREFNYNIIAGFLTKLGLVWDLEELSLGLTFTSPQYLFPLKSGNYQVSNFLLMSEDEINQSTFNNRDPRQISFRTPFSVGFGVSYFLNDSHCINFSTEHFSRIGQYAIIDDRKGSTYQLRDAANSVTNFAVGFEAELSEALFLLTGFKTNFNHRQDFQVNAANQMKVNKFNWNVYHISAGGYFRIKSFAFSVGVEYAFSNSVKNRLFTPYNEATALLDFESLTHDQAPSTFRAFSLHFNYSLFFSSIFSR